MGDLFDQDLDPEIFGPPPMWARQLDRRAARRSAAIHQQLDDLKETMMPTLADLDSAIAAVAQAVTDLAARMNDVATNPVPQATIDSVNALHAQVAGLDPAPAPAPTPAPADPNAPPA